MLGFRRCRLRGSGRCTRPSHPPSSSSFCGGHVNRFTLRAQAGRRPSTGRRPRSQLGTPPQAPHHAARAVTVLPTQRSPFAVPPTRRRSAAYCSRLILPSAPRLPYLASYSSSASLLLRTCKTARIALLRDANIGWGRIFRLADYRQAHLPAMPRPRHAMLSRATTTPPSCHAWALYDPTRFSHLGKVQGAHCPAKQALPPPATSQMQGQ